MAQDEATGPRGYREVSLIGAGATSRVYRAVEVDSGREVALKRLHRQLVRDDKTLARLRRELRALGKLRHPGIVAVHDVIEWDSDPTIVMDFVAGEDLKERIMKQGRLDAVETERVARALLDILAMSHGSGIVHRDLKPQNIRIDPKGGVHLLDFGSARLDAESQLTTTGATVGTPEYMAPELFAGSVYDPRVDIYGLGAVLYECLTGNPPQHADSLATLAYLRTTCAIAPVADVAPEVPAHLSQVIDRCLARDPEDRYASATLALWALDNPTLEQAFAAQRAHMPLCLHCATPIPAESRVCSACKKERPFQFAAGAHSVLIRSLTDAPDFLRFVAERLPERARPDALTALAERCAGLGFAPQRLASFVSLADANHLVTTCKARGVRAEAVVEPRFGRGFVALALLLLLAGAVKALAIVGIAAGLGVLLLGRLARITCAQASVLSQARWPHPLSTGLLDVVAGAWALWLTTFALSWLAAQPFDVMDPGWTAWLARLAGLLAACTAVVLAFGYTRPRGARQRAAHPGVRSQLLASFRDRGHDDDKGNTRASHGGAAMLLLTIMVALELVLLPALVAWDPRPVGAQQATIDGPRDRPSPRAQVLQLAALQEDLIRSGDGLSSSLRLPLMLATPPLLMATLLWRRRRRVRRDAAALYSELDLEAFRELAQRPLPASIGKKDGLADRIARIDSPDPFVHEAIKRAARLSHLLNADSVARLSDALEALQAGRRGGQEAGRSLLARCIAEADPAQKTRLSFLALEGQLEAVAAAQWASRAVRAEARP